MTKAEKTRLVKAVIFTLLLAAAAAAALMLAKRLGGFIPCIFHQLTRLRCPGCGNTRAAAALVHGRLADSLRLNYAYPAQYAYLFTVFLRGFRSYVRGGKVSLNPRYPVPEYVFLGLMLVWGVVRNILGV